MKKWIKHVNLAFRKLVQISPDSTPVTFDTERSSRLFENVELINATVGKFSYVQKNTVVFNSDIGNFCSIANDVFIGLAEHPTNFVSTSPIFYDPTQPLPKFLAEETVFKPSDRRTLIQSDVWIGAGAIIKSGMIVGFGAVIGAGAVVTKDVAPYSVVVGNPARVVRKRFTDQQIARLLNSQWWELDEDYLSSIWRTFLDIELFLKEIEK